jgi:hypothetical protein
VAASSWGVPAMASLSTGLQPWQHGALHAGRASLAPELTTFAEALDAAGWRTLGFTTGIWLTRRHGYDQGFDLLRDLGRGHKAETRLAHLDGRELVWVHLDEPQAPYRLRNRFLDRVPDAPTGLPRRVEEIDLERWFDPARPLPEPERRVLWAMYRLNVAAADERLGRLLDAARRNGWWERTLLAVTASHGEAFGERGQVGHGGGLGREQLEVPLLVKLPRAFPRRLAPPATERVATARLWATLVEAAGGRPLPAAAPSLFRRGAGPIVSELYLTNGSNHFSLVVPGDAGGAGDLQLLWEARFAPPEPGYYAARLASLAGGGGGGRESRALFERLGAAFDAAPPLWGVGGPETALVRWTEAGTEPVDDPALEAELAARLERAFRRAAPDVLSPGEAR